MAKLESSGPQGELEQAVVGVAQLVEPWIVIPVVVGSNPIVHPIFFRKPRIAALPGLVEGLEQWRVHSSPVRMW